MTSICDDGLTIIAREIAAKQRYVEDQATLIEVLEHDGHDVVEQRQLLDKNRLELARQIERQVRLLRDKVYVGERRKHERTEVDEVAYIFGDGSSLRCRVVNMSVQGAAIQLPLKLHVNSTFKLMLERDRIIRSCRLIWSSGDRIGVSFEDRL